MNKNILFIGANGYMGHGMSLNLLKQNNLYVIANRQRNNIENLIKEGAKEVNSYKEIKNLNKNIPIIFGGLEYPDEDYKKKLFLEKI